MLQQQWPRIFRQIRVGYNFCQNHYYSSEINSVPLTTDRYPNVKRGDFAILQESDVNFFESIIGANRILTQEDELNGINILLTSSNNQISEFQIPNIYNEISFILFFA